MANLSLNWNQSVKWRLLTIGTVFFLHLAALADEKPQAPSQFGYAGCPFSFSLVERADMRTLCCERKILLERIKKGVCVVDNFPGGPKEILVETGDTVGAVYKKVGEDCAITPQLCLISKDAVRQSSLTFLRACDDAQFMNLKVSAGDFLVFASRQ